jgi:RNA polymerase-binding transcription factor DksA
MINLGIDLNKKQKLSKSEYASTHKVCKACGAPMPILGKFGKCEKCKKAVRAKRKYNWWNSRMGPKTSKV